MAKEANKMDLELIVPIRSTAKGERERERGDGS